MKAKELIRRLEKCLDMCEGRKFDFEVSLPCGGKDLKITQDYVRGEILISCKGCDGEENENYRL